MAGALRMDDTQYPMKFNNEFMVDLPYLHETFEVKPEPFVPETVHGPYLQIIEEPKQRGFRFRYECEGPSHGGLPGASSERNRRTYPTVKVSNYLGQARVEVQLVTHTDPPRVHAHSLVGRHCNDNGICTIDVGPNDLTAQFSNLGILHVTKRGVAEVLTKRLKEEKRRMKEPGYKFTDAEEQAILHEAKELGKSMDLNIVRLKFTAYLQDSNGSFTRALRPVVSNPIYDSKSPNASNLKISRMDKTSGSVLGGEEIFLLCDKVQKDDIDIRFYEEEDDGGWEAFGDFSPTDVHKQYAIVFKTPPYRCADILRPVTVFLQLRRKKGGDCSEPKQFTYIPHNQDKEEVQRKRMKALPQPYDHWRGGPQGGAGSFGGPGSGAGGGGGGMGGGYQFNPVMDASGFFTGGCGGFSGGAQMSGSTPQADGSPNQPTNTQTQSGSQMQQQLFQIATVLQNRASLMAKYSARALLQYCSTGDVRPLLLLQRHLCGVQDENGDTPLHLAVIHQQPIVVQQLIQALSNTPQQKFINKLNKLNQAPLHLAVITKQPKLVEMLMKTGADPSLLDREGRTALHLAAHTGDETILRLILGLLGERSAHLINSADFSGQYPVHLAVKKDGERCLGLLVEAGAKINMPEQKSGCTALHLAVRDNLLKLACYLITELKADVNACTYGGNSPLHFAASQGSPHLCSMLIATGADKRMENDEPLFFQSSSSSDEDDESVKNEVDRQLPDHMVQQVHCMSISSEKRTFNPRKRPAAGHTPFDLAKCQKVRDLLDGRKGPKPSSIAHKRTKISTEEANQGLDNEVLTKLCGILIDDCVPWRELAEKLGMLTLSHLYQDSASPCQKLLENYQLSGGPVDGLVEALQSLGVSEGVRLLRDSQPREDKQSTDSKADSGFGSQSIGEEMGNPAVANH
ncbi:nuclear factor NF-kappa-B p100 subunit [Carassius gibelio]|uniref:nuclear factor NF-kappa-B p100 subunit n=1 Tax=Carassius gibelio TaxID=101364 RepID=UPI002279AC55|nr:nuclear factor NF-kappa-B p100 subunit [Carassius gibelio]